MENVRKITIASENLGKVKSLVDRFNQAAGKESTVVRNIRSQASFQNEKLQEIRPVSAGVAEGQNCRTASGEKLTSALNYAPAIIVDNSLPRIRAWISQALQFVHDVELPKQNFYPGPPAISVKVLMDYGIDPGSGCIAEESSFDSGSKFSSASSIAQKIQAETNCAAWKLAKFLCKYTWFPVTKDLMNKIITREPSAIVELPKIHHCLEQLHVRSLLQSLDMDLSDTSGRKKGIVGRTIINRTKLAAYKFAWRLRHPNAFGRRCALWLDFENEWKTGLESGVKPSVATRETYSEGFRLLNLSKHLGRFRLLSVKAAEFVEEARHSSLAEYATLEEVVEALHELEKALNRKSVFPIWALLRSVLRLGAAVEELTDEIRNVSARLMYIEAEVHHRMNSSCGIRGSDAQISCESGIESGQGARVLCHKPTLEGQSAAELKAEPCHSSVSGSSADERFAAPTEEEHAIVSDMEEPVEYAFLGNT